MKHNTILRRVLPFLVILLCIPLGFLLFTGLLGGKMDQESLGMAEQTVRRAAVQCYALEGAYPASLAYLQEKYGVTLDEGRFFVDYRFVASNLMPDITVLPVA